MTCPDQNWINISQNCHHVTSGSWCFESSIYFVPIFFTYPSFHCLFFGKYNKIREISCSIHLNRDHLVLSSVPAHWRHVAWDILFFKYLNQWQHSLAILTAVLYCYWLKGTYVDDQTIVMRRNYQSCFVSKETNDVTVTRGTVWSDKV